MEKNNDDRSLEPTTPAVVGSVGSVAQQPRKRKVQTMNFHKVAEILKSAGVADKVDANGKRFLKLENEHGVRIYIARPNKSGNTRRVEVSGWGYDLRYPDGSPILGATEVVDNGNVSFALDLDDKAGEETFWQLLSAFEQLKPQPNPRAKGRGGRLAAGPEIDVKAALGQAVS